MELSWSTFVLELINFLVLVWILQRFLYKPVLAAIARRKAAIDQTVADAQSAQARAEALEQQFQNRLGDWEREKQRLREKVDEELAAHREQMMTALEQELAQQREKEKVLAERRMTDLKHQAQAEERANAVRFLARLLRRVAGPELETRLVQVALADLSQLGEAQRSVLEKAGHDPANTFAVTTAFPLSAERRREITEALKDVTGQPHLDASFDEDPQLMAGLRIRVGPWNMRANMQDELAFFSEMGSRGPEKA